MYYILKFFSFGIHLIGKRGRWCLAYALSFFMYKILGLRKKVILKNLAIALKNQYTKAEQDQIAFRSFFNFTNNMLEFLGAADGKLSSQVTIKGGQHLEEALKKGKGVFILCTHMGSWEAMGGAYNSRFVPTYVIVKKVGSESSNRFVEEHRNRNGFKWVDRSEGKGSASKKILKALRKGEVIGFAMDQSRPGEPYLPFFGSPAKTNTSLGAMALRSDVPVLPSYIHRTGLSSHEVVIGEEIPLPTSGTEEENILEAANLFNREVEKIILAHPEEYFWMHNRWK